MSAGHVPAYRKLSNADFFVSRKAPCSGLPKTRHTHNTRITHGPRFRQPDPLTETLYLRRKLSLVLAGLWLPCQPKRTPATAGGQSADKAVHSCPRPRTARFDIRSLDSLYRESRAVSGSGTPETVMNAANNDAVVVIPARYASTRIPGKPLADIGGTPMIERVYRRACLAKLPAQVIVATDDERIYEAAAGFAEVRMTGTGHQSGSDRVGEVAAGLHHGIVVNLQGDLPLLDPALIDDLIAALRADPGLGMATIAVPVSSSDELRDPSIVKVVCDRGGRALYFSRSPIPFDRDDPGSGKGALHHIGIYAYRRATLSSFCSLPPGELEKREKLEQLRALENGIVIGVVRHDGPAPMEVDTPGELEKVRAAVADLTSGERAAR